MEKKCAAGGRAYFSSSEMLKTRLSKHLKIKVPSTSNPIRLGNNDVQKNGQAKTYDVRVESTQKDIWPRTRHPNTKVENYENRRTAYAV